MSFNKQTIRQSGIQKIQKVLDHIDQAYTVEEYCTVDDRAGGAYGENQKGITLKAIMMPGKDGAFYESVVRNPAPDANDVIILRKTKNNNKNKFIPIIEKQMNKNKRKKYKLEEL